MSVRESLDDCFASPVRARSLLTVRAAISFARFADLPCFCSLSLTCSYCRSRLLDHACCGIRISSFAGETARGGLGLLDGLVVNVVLDRILLGELVHDAHALAVCVVDLDERVPLVGERVLREDRLDRALRFARPAISGHDSAGHRERVLPRDDRAEAV